LVVTSASPRAIETAVAMGFAVDDTVEFSSGYVPGEVEHHDQWRWPRPYRTYAELLGRGLGLASVAEAHRRIWTAVVEAVPDGAAVLVIAHGGGIEPGLVACLPDADYDTWGGHSATATAPASASTKAGSQRSRSAGRLRRPRHSRGSSSRSRNPEQQRSQMSQAGRARWRAAHGWHRAAGGDPAHLALLFHAPRLDTSDGARRDHREQQAPPTAAPSAENHPPFAATKQRDHHRRQRRPQTCTKRCLHC
jgi:hypothetical protein